MADKKIVEEVTPIVEEIGAFQDVPVEKPAEPSGVEARLKEMFFNMHAELEARIEQLEKDAKKLKSGLPQLGW